MLLIFLKIKLIRNRVNIQVVWSIMKRMALIRDWYLSRCSSEGEQREKLITTNGDSDESE